MIFRFITATFILVSAASAAAGVVVDRSEHTQKISALEGRVSAIQNKADGGDSAGLIKTLKDVNRDSTLDIAIRDYLLEETILALSATTPGPDERQVVQQFLGRPVETFVRLDDEHGSAVVPMYDLAAASRLTLRVWDTAIAKAVVAGRIRAGQWQPVNALNPRDEIPADAWQAGTIFALETAEITSLAAQKSALLESQKLSSQIDPLIHVAARRTGDADLYRAVILNGNLNDARAAIATVGENGPQSYSEILIAATDREELASSAILELGAKASMDPDIYRWLLRRLAHPSDGASAALALARELNNEILTDLRIIILGNQSELTKLRAALVLRMSELPSAHSLRLELQSESLLSEQLRGALQ